LNVLSRGTQKVSQLLLGEFEFVPMFSNRIHDFGFRVASFYTSEASMSERS
jgi:hypothetical protein